MLNALRAYSLGYEGITLVRYVEVLKTNKISVVIDVRETPWSYKPGFSKKPLSEALEANGIIYIHVKAAGNPSRNRKLGLPQQEVIERYKQHLASDPSCLDEIYELIRNNHQHGGVCLLCFERSPHDCHRKVILDRLAECRGELISCHLNGSLSESEELIVEERVPKANNGKRARIHMEVPENECGLVSA